MRLGFEGGGTEKKEKEKREEKIPHMCESIGHRLLRGRCPINDMRKKIAVNTVAKTATVQTN